MWALKGKYLKEGINKRSEGQKFGGSLHPSQSANTIKAVFFTFHQMELKS